MAKKALLTDEVVMAVGEVEVVSGNEVADGLYPGASLQ